METTTVNNQGSRPRISFTEVKPLANRVQKALTKVSLEEIKRGARVTEMVVYRLKGGARILRESATKLDEYLTSIGE